MGALNDAFGAVGAANDAFSALRVSGACGFRVRDGRVGGGVDRGELVADVGGRKIMIIQNFSRGLPGHVRCRPLKVSTPQVDAVHRC